MAYHLKENTSSASTTWTPKVDKLRRTPRPEGQHGAAKQPRFSGLDRRNPKLKLTVQITYRGGSEAWWLIEARGRSAVFPGHMCIHDVMTEINRSWGGME